MVTPSNPAIQVREFIASNFLYGQERNFSDSDSFLAEDIIDSTGVLQLVSFLEETYGITIEDEELTPDNLDSVSSVTSYLARKLGGTSQANVPDAQAAAQEGNL